MGGNTLLAFFPQMSVLSMCWKTLDSLFIYFFFLADKLNVSHNFGQKNFKCVKENAHLFSPNFSYYLLISSVSMLYLL